jgi:hypothetical protein
MVERPYAYRRHELIEPDWQRLPGWARVTPGEWESAQWQRAHCVKNARQLRDVTGGSLGEEFFADLERDQRQRATMSMLITPRMTRPLTGSGQLAGAAQRRGQRLTDRLDQQRHLVGHQIGIARWGGEHRQT